MKKLLAISLVILMVFGFIGCGNNNQTGTASGTKHTHTYANATCISPQKCSCGATKGSALGHTYSGKTCSRCGASNPNYTESTKPQHVHTYTNATCTSPQRCLCGATKGSALGHAYSGKTCSRCGASNPNYKEQHTHYYTSRVTKEATCAAEGTRTYTCSCGHSYTEAINKTSYHNWQYATCTSPKKCKICGSTEGNPEEHNYRTYDGYKCSMCGQVDPTVQSTLSQCSLQLPTLPKTITYYGYSGKIYSRVNVTNITYQFEYYDNGNIILTAKFSGTKTYDYNGAGQSSACRIGWKLYDPDGNVFRTGTFSSPSVAMGESFANQEDDLIYNFEASKPGKYRLEILDVN